MVSVVKDEQGRLSLDVRELGDGEYIDVAKEFEVPLSFDVKRKGADVVVGKRYLYKVEVPSVGKVGLFVPDYSLGRGPQGTKLYQLLDDETKGELFRITKIQKTSQSGRNYALYTVSRPEGGALEIGVKDKVVAPKAASPAVSTETGTDTVSTDSIGDSVKNTLVELGLDATPDVIDSVSAMIITNVKTPNGDNIKTFITNMASEQGVL